MQPQPTAPIPVTRSGIAVVDGYGVQIRVERGRLVVADSVRGVRRESRFARATHGIRRLVLLGHTGYVSVEALRWLADVGIGYVQFDAERRLLSASAGFGLEEPRLRRAQAASWGTSAGLGIARRILQRKLEGQARVARLLERDDIAATIELLSPALASALSPAELMVPEAAAANAYWSAWQPVQIRWASRDARHCPAHWHRFGMRASPLTSNPRLAANPANAMLNYLYALAEGEARLACLALGLDPGLGFLHVDQRGRDSLALDLIEAVRPEIDEWLVRLLHARTFRPRDFLEGRKGVCRVVPPLTHELAQTIDVWRRSVGPVAESLAAELAVAVEGPIVLPTPLTERRRSAGRYEMRRRSSPTLPEGATRLSVATCVACGDRAQAKRRYCRACRPDIDAFAATGAASLSAAREAGRDPAHGGEVAEIRASKWRQRRKLEAAWERGHARPDPAAFRSIILPAIRDLPTRRLVELTGLTRAYCARIQKGELVPHPRWWESLGQLVMGVDSGIDREIGGRAHTRRPEEPQPVPALTSPSK